MQTSAPVSEQKTKKMGWLPFFVFTIFCLIIFLIYKNPTVLTSLWKPHTSSDSESAKIWVHYGTLQHHVGELSEAYAAYEQAKNLNPHLYEAWWNLSLAQNAMNLPQEQLLSLQQAVRCRPGSPEAWAALTKLYMELNRDPEAMVAREQEQIAKNESPRENQLEREAFESQDSPQPWIDWGMSRAIYRFVQPLCFDSKTEEIFKKATELHPQSPWVWAHYGLASLKKKNEVPGSPFLTEVQIPDLVPFQKAAELSSKDPTLFFILGRAALWKGEFNIAINAFQISTRSPQTHWLAWYYLGETYLAAKRSDEAIAAYTKAQSLSPNSLEIQYGVAQAHIQKELIDEAQRILEQEKPLKNQIIPLTRRAMVQLALHESKLNDPPSPSPAQKINSPSSLEKRPFRASAIPREESVLILDPLPQIKLESPEPLSAIQPRAPQNLGLLQETQNKSLSTQAPQDPEPLKPHLPIRSIPPQETTRETIEDWTRALLENSLTEKELQTLFQESEKKKQYDLMLQVALKLVQINPSEHHWINLGYTYGLQNRIDKEIDAYQKALLKNPKNRTALMNTGLALLDQKQISKSQTYFLKISQLHPHDIEAWFHLGLTYEKQERWNEAAKAYQQATTLKPTYREAWLNLGGVYNSIKRPDLEIETYRKCLEFNPDYQPAWHNLAIALKSVGKFHEYETTQKLIQDSIR